MNNSKLQYKWNKILAAEGLQVIDAEYRQDKQPDFREGRRTAIDTNPKPIHEPRQPLYELTASYYNRASTLDTNWATNRWSRTKLGRLEHRIWHLHANDGLNGSEIYKILKKNKDVIKGECNSIGAVFRIVRKWQAVLMCFDFDAVGEDWIAGGMCVKMMQDDPALNANVKKILARRQWSREEVQDGII